MRNCTALSGTYIYELHIPHTLVGDFFHPWDKLDASRIHSPFVGALELKSWVDLGTAVRVHSPYSGCLQLWKTWKSQGICYSGKLREFKMYSDVCIIVINSTLNWLGGTVTGVDGASHHSVNSARKLLNWLLKWFVTSGFHFMIVWKRLIRGSGKPRKLREFHFARFVSTVILQLLNVGWICNNIIMCNV